MAPRRYLHAGRQVEALRFVGNGPEIAAWVGPQALSHGVGLTGSLTLFVEKRLKLVACGDWVVKVAPYRFVTVPQEIFAAEYREVEHADEQ